ncbi:protease activator YjfN [Escherichia coli]|nr:protease activator YjfN [Escherichia coli]
MKQLLASPSLQLVTYPASATAQSAEFASADCVTGLNEIGQILVSNISGDPQDVERIVALKADEQGASWYRIITMYEDQQPDNWRVQAILYA